MGGVVEGMNSDTSRTYGSPWSDGLGHAKTSREGCGRAGADDCLVVVIEDDGLVRTAVSAYLEALGCEVRAAGSAEAASDLCGALPRDPRLMICDYGLPGGMNGLQVITSARSRFGGDFSAYLMTGLVSQEVMARCREIGIPIIYKPVSPGTLKSIVEQARE